MSCAVVRVPWCVCVYVRPLTSACAVCRYVARTWNFYLFPRPYGWCDRRFTCQAASLQFLLEHKFDFNKFIYEVRTRPPTHAAHAPPHAHDTTGAGADLGHDRVWAI
jgi:hypothetical protein